MPLAPIRGHDLWYEDSGRGPRVTLLHHATASSRSFDDPPKPGRAAAVI